MHERRTFLVPKVHRIIEFLASQGIAMAGRLFYGFLCIRLLPISEYAKFAVVFGFLGTLSVLMDICFSTTLLPLVGEHVDDSQLIADYVASIRHLAHRLYLVVAPAAVLVFPLLVHKQRWSWQVVAVMVAILLIASWCDRVSGVYGAVLILRRDRGFWYRAQMISSLGSLALLGVLWLFHAVNAFSAILISLAAIVYVALSYYFRARKLLGVAGHFLAERRDAIIHLALPIMPNTIFYAFQGQISLILITLFGHASAVASVGALGRLGQIFILFGQMSPLLLEPYFARLPEVRVKRNYLVMLALQVSLCLSMTGLAWGFPGIFLWVLGHKYGGLRYEVLLMIAGSSIGYLSGMLWVIHCARRFVYWWSGMMTIFLTLSIQALFIWKVDLSTVRAVLILNLTTAAAGLLVNVLTGVYGFIWGPRKTANLPMIPAGDYYA